MKGFEFTALPFRVVFGDGRVERLGAELAAAGIERPLLVCSRGGRQRAEAAIGGTVSLAGVFDAARMHVPVETVRAAAGIVDASGADGTIAFGGGSTIGLAKILARDVDCPYVAVPTTYAGSEMTPLWGSTEAGRKQTGRDPRVLPRAVIYDPLLTVGLPASIAAASGINAMAHSVEALYAENANPAISAVSEQSIRLLSRALPGIVANPEDVETRGVALQGAWLAGLALGSVGMALHHKLCHVLGGSYGLDHALTHSVVLPHALAYNREAAPEAFAAVARALGRDDAALGLYELARGLGLPTSLEALGMPADRLDEAAESAARNPYYNPADVTRDGVRALLGNAWRGRAPAPVSPRS